MHRAYFESITAPGGFTPIGGLSMPWILAKYLITATIVVAVSELARRSDRLGAALASLPLVTILTLVWLHVEQQPAAKIANHAFYTFWYVIPTLPMFLVFPLLYGRWGFWPALAACALVTVACFGVFALVARRFGIELL